jgi:AcrR family transcriptional regulator
MPSVETRERLLDASEPLFAEQGYSATSMRQIIARAGVNSAAIHYHFGSKQDLFVAVVARRLEPVTAERLRRLDDLESQADGGPVPVESILEALIEPALATSLGAGHGGTWVKLLARFRTEPGDHWTETNPLQQEMLSRFLAAFARALPHLPEAEVKYRFFFAIGAAINTAIDKQGMTLVDHTLPSIYEEPDSVVTRLVCFTAAGMKAPYERRTAS